MLIVILISIFGLLFAYFATGNTALVSIKFGQYIFPGVPLYLVILASLAIGLIIAGLIYFLKSLSSSFTISEKEDALKEAKKESAELTKQVHKLELENTKLKTELGKQDTDEDTI